MKCFLAALAIALLSLPGLAVAKEYCSRGWICVGVLEKDSAVEVYARNLKNHPVTLSLRMRARDLPRMARRSETRTVDGGGREVIKRFPPSQSRDYRFYYDWTVGRTDAQHDDEYLYRLPYARDARYRVLQGYQTGFSHNGLEAFTVDFDMPVGTPVYAARSGVVAMAVEEHDIGCWEDWCSRYANYMIVVHEDGTTGEYYHLARDGALVDVGERVEKGQLIARSGNTGHTTMPHLHFGVYRADDWGTTQSIPVRFETRSGVVSRPRAGRRYEVK